MLQHMPLTKLQSPGKRNYIREREREGRTVPALALTTSVPAFWILSVRETISSSVKVTLGEVYIIQKTEDDHVRGWDHTRKQEINSLT